MYCDYNFSFNWQASGAVGIGDKMMDQFLHIGWLIQQT